MANRSIKAKIANKIKLRRQSKAAKRNCYKKPLYTFTAPSELKKLPA